MNTVIGWAFYMALVLGGLAALAWTTIVVNRFGEQRLQLRDAKLAFWTLGAFIVLSLGAWLPMTAVLGAKGALRRATYRRVKLLI